MFTLKKKAPSQAQIEANRQNAQKSTGPRTEEGKNVSKMNATTHGMCAKIPVLPGENREAFEAERQAWMKDWHPVGKAEIEQVEQAAAASWALKRCREHEELVLEDRAEKAVEEMEDQRVEEVAKLADELPLNPMVAAAKLQRTAEGCRWMRDRWHRLGTELDQMQIWSPREKDLALNLLGMRPSDLFETNEARTITFAFLRLGATDATDVERLKDLLRSAQPEDMSDDDFDEDVHSFARRLPSSEDAHTTLCELVVREINAIQDQIEQLDARADADRARVAAEKALFDDSPSAALRLRYTNSHHRMLMAALAELRALQAERIAGEEDEDNPFNFLPNAVNEAAEDVRSEPNLADSSLAKACADYLYESRSELAPDTDPTLLTTVCAAFAPPTAADPA